MFLALFSPSRLCGLYIYVGLCLDISVCLYLKDIWILRYLAWSFGQGQNMNIDGSCSRVGDNRLWYVSILPNNKWDKGRAESTTDCYSGNHFIDTLGLEVGFHCPPIDFCRLSYVTLPVPGLAPWPTGRPVTASCPLWTWGKDRYEKMPTPPPPSQTSLSVLNRYRRSDADPICLSDIIVARRDSPFPMHSVEITTDPCRTPLATRTRRIA